MSRQFSKSKSQTQKGIKLVSWSVTIAVAIASGTALSCIALLVTDAKVTGQSQSPPSAEQSVDLEEAKRLNQQVIQLYQEGKYSTAIPLAERVLAIREKVLGKEHPDVATSLNNLALLYSNQGNYQQAEPLYQRSLAIWEKVLGKEHFSVATSLNNLAELYREQGNYQQAEPLYQRSLAIREKLLGKEHPAVATSLNNLALLYQARGNYQQAEPLLQHALAIREKVLGKEHPDVAKSLNNLALLYRAQGNYQQAEPLLQRALAIGEKVQGKEHPDVAQSLNNLAALYHTQGNYQQAEPLYQRSLAIKEKVLGKEHPDVAQSLNNLAALYHTQGNYQQAEPLLQRSLAIREKVLGKEHPDVAQSLNNLAALYRAQGNYQQAEPLYQRSLAIWEKVLGKEHPDVATSLNNLAALYHTQGNYQQAEPLLQRSLAIREKVLGKEHPDVAQSLNNLALLYRAQGNYQQAEPLYQRSLAIWEKVLGKEHPDVATSLNNLAALYQAQGNVTRAIDFRQRGLEVEENNLALIFAVGSEERKQDYVRTFAGTTYRTISLSLQEAHNHPRAAQLALTTVLRRKGLVLDAVADNAQILRSQLANKPEIKKLFDEWLNVLQQQSKLVYGEQRTQTPDKYKATFEQLEAQRQRLEGAISAQSAEFRNEIQPVELAAIQAKIPKDAALVEIVQYQPFNAKANKPNEQWGKQRYAAAVLHSVGEPKWVDLGEAAVIDQSIIDTRAALTNRTLLKPAQELARKLDKQVMAPIRPLLGNVRHVLLSPDGQLTLFPFEALRDEQGQYLIQRYTVSYLTSGRDLLRFQLPAKSRFEPVVLADIDYEQQQTTGEKPKLTNVRSSQKRRSAELASLNFEPLPSTKEEAAVIQKVLPNVKLLLGKEATETALKQLHAPSILHLATHGFFISDQERSLDSPGSVNSDQQQNFNPSFPEFGQSQPKVLQIENPLLRSGLALAGINKRNRTSADNDDGVLTALEVTGLDLRGTQLVVLSACETGAGDIKVGEGVYGLRRALVIAGSSSQVLSFWALGDEETKDLMVKYYQKLKAGKGRHEALREAQLEFLNTPGYEHPYYWASFTPSGDWTPLSLK